ncbi:beta-N-acetylhexosaminidase [Xanthobacteraceae bacterium Astr-EGSB]|uniref:beta-N-acetylhexosaminidase n=1 Tax=Astrobacterium formosum TaxID=3069710 RepID=UPI0027B7A160|nr:beta-N-acetylhexosaminidase [Xanthobacteraceae bacterium Astr-EGSB]
MARAFITGVSGPLLTPDEKAFVREARPWALIVFKRNVADPEQVHRLVNDFRDAVGAKVPVLVDQEGGRVQRLGPPHWRAYPAGESYGHLYDRDPEAGLAAARLGARLIAHDLAEVGIDVDCLPLADVPAVGASPVISDRAYGNSPAKVAAIAQAIADGLMAGGCLPVLKHLPGHGRAAADSHAELPVVTADPDSLDAVDFAAFKALRALPLGMTAHVVFTAFDPELPATTSPTMIARVIRERIGFAGALMSDDLSMGALSGTIAERTRAALAAGCDLALHCNGDLAEMHEVAEAAPELAGEAGRRADAALRSRRAAQSIDITAARNEFARLMARAGVEVEAT